MSTAYISHFVRELASGIPSLSTYHISHSAKAEEWTSDLGMTTINGPQQSIHPDDHAGYLWIAMLVGLVDSLTVWDTYIQLEGPCLLSVRQKTKSQFRLVESYRTKGYQHL